jgi:hypothetical protein
MAAVFGKLYLAELFSFAGWGRDYFNLDDILSCLEILC